MSDEVLAGAVFEHLSSGIDDGEVPEADKPPLQVEQVKVEMEGSSAKEPLECDVGVVAQQSDSLADVKPHSASTAETYIAHTTNLDLKMSNANKFSFGNCSWTGWLWNCSLYDNKVGDVLMWQEPKLSAAIFVTGLALLLSLATFSVIAITAYWALIFLAVNIVFGLIKIIPAGFKRSPSAHPFSKILEMDLTPSEESIEHWKDSFIAYTTRFANYICHIVLIEDVVDSMTCALVLWIMTYIGALFNGMTLAIMFYIFVFAVPKLYDTYQVHIIYGIHMAQSQLKLFYDRIQAHISF